MDLGSVCIIPVFIYLFELNSLQFSLSFVLFSFEFKNSTQVLYSGTEALPVLGPQASRLI
jgi:hypothetical protein